VISALGPPELGVIDDWGRIDGILVAIVAVAVVAIVALRSEESGNLERGSSVVTA
jgi:hypothetical protein